MESTTKNNKNKAINVRITNDMYDSFSKKADASGLSISQLIRAAVLLAYKIDHKKISFIKTKGEYGKLSDEDLIPSLVDRAAKHLGYE